MACGPSSLLRIIYFILLLWYIKIIDHLFLQLGDLALYEIYKKPNPKQIINGEGEHQVEGEGLASKSLSNVENMENEKSDNHQIQSLHPHCQFGYDPHSSNFNNADSLLQPVELSFDGKNMLQKDENIFQISPVQLNISNDSPYLALIPSWNSASLSSGNQLMPLLQYTPQSEFSITADPCSPDQLQLECIPTLQPNFLVDHLMLPTSQSSASTTLWPLSKTSFNDENILHMPPVQLGITDDSSCLALIPPSWFGNSTNSSLRSQLMPLPKYIPELDITIDQFSPDLSPQVEYIPTLQMDFLTE